MTNPKRPVLGVDFGGTKVALGVADGDGRLLAQRRVPTEAELGAEQAVDRALSEAKLLLAEQGIDPENLGGVGVVSPGIVRDTEILLAPNVPGWSRLHLADAVHGRLGPAPVVVGTDAKAAALAEWTSGALAGADPAVYLSLGTGVAAAVVSGGRVLPGANGAAGEIGYNLRDPAAREGYATGRAPLEEAVGGRGLARRARAALGREMSAARLLELASEGHAAARKLAAEALDELAAHVANLAILVDPETIAVGGGLLGAAGEVLPPLRACLDRAVPFPPKLVPSHYGSDAALYGAVILALA